MKISIGCIALLIGLLVAWIGYDDPSALANEEACATSGSNVVQWTGPPADLTKEVTSSGLAVDYYDAIAWCYKDLPDFGSFALQSVSDESVTGVEFSPAYYYPWTHYGVLQVNVTATLTDELDGAMVTRVNQVYPWSYSDRNVEITYAAP